MTLEVSRDEMSREGSEEQPANITAMLVTCEVSRGERSREASESQPENIPPVIIPSSL